MIVGIYVRIEVKHIYNVITYKSLLNILSASPTL